MNTLVVAGQAPLCPTSGNTSLILAKEKGADWRSEIGAITFLAKNFTMSFFEEIFRSVLEFCGSHSCRDVDKATETGITPIEGTSGTVYFAEARLVIECEKIYFHDLNPDNFLDPKIHRRYTDKDYHRMYIGEIIRCLIR